LLAHFRQDITSFGHRLGHDISRARLDLRHARDEYHLAKAERPRLVDRLSDLVARYQGVTLYRDRVQRGQRVYPLTGAYATVAESPARRTDLGTVRDVRLTVTGPDWEWSINTVAVFNARKARAFAALINSYASAPGRRSARVLAGQHG